MRSRFKSKRVKSKSKIDITLIYKTFSFFGLLLVLFVLISSLSKKYINKYAFEKDFLAFEELNPKTLFSINKITLYNSSNATQNKDIKQGLSLDIHQYTDIAIDISNFENIEIKEFYINNISFSKKPDLGNPCLLYKNPLEFGKLITLNSKEETDSINFKVIDPLKENINFDENIIYSNLSNPITLTYLNKNVRQGYSTINSSTLIFDGTLLNSTKIDLEKLSCNFSFDINIKIQDDSEYICKVNIPITLKDKESTIYSGSFLQILETTRFIQIL